MLATLRRYLIRELLQYWLSVTLVLWLVLVATRFSLYLGQAASGRLPAEVVFSLLGLKSVAFLAFLLPLSFFLALLLVLGRWNQDRETLVLAASGASPLCLVRVLAWPVTLLTLLVALLSLSVVPHTTHLGYELRAEASRSMQHASLVPGQFVSLRGGQLLLFAERIEVQHHLLEDVFLLSGKGARQSVLTAAAARFEHDEQGGASRLVLLNGARYDGKPGSLDYRVLSFNQYLVSLGSEAAETEVKWDAVPTLALPGHDEAAAVGELQQRLSRPLSVPVLTLLALGLGRFHPRQGRYTRLFAGILLFLAYFNLLAAARVWLDKQQLAVWPGLGWIHLSFMLLALVLLVYRRRR